jgi:hypothetical protein
MCFLNLTSEMDLNVSDEKMSDFAHNQKHQTIIGEPLALSPDVQTSSPSTDISW